MLTAGLFMNVKSVAFYERLKAGPLRNVKSGAVKEC